MNTLAKGLLMTVITFIATAIATTGIPATSIAWEVMGITVVGTVIGYIGQSLILPSTSPEGVLNYRDALKGALVALGNFLAAIGATELVGTVIDWKGIATGVLALLVGYFAKQFTSTPKGIPPTK